MRYIRILHVFIIGVFLSSCATGTVEPNFSFSAENETLVVLKARELGKTVLAFREVDLENKKFSKGNFSIALNDWLASRKLTSAQPPVPGGAEFYATKASAGDYAYILKWEHIPTKTTVTCFSLGTVVFRIIPGKINLLDFSGIRDLRGLDPDIRRGITPSNGDDLKNVLAAYPNVKGEVVTVKAVAAIKFEGHSVLFGSSCPVGNSLEVIARPK